MRSENTKAQTARVVLTEQGYKADSIRLRQGILARITLLRQAVGSCGTEIFLPDQGVKRALPLNKPVVVAFTPNEEEIHHIGVVFDLASKAAGVRLASKGVALGASKEQFL
jgi:plastocyanin domain-containing protein